MANCKQDLPQWCNCLTLLARWRYCTWCVLYWLISAPRKCREAGKKDKRLKYFLNSMPHLLDHFGKKKWRFQYRHIGMTRSGLLLGCPVDLSMPIIISKYLVFTFILYFIPYYYNLHDLSYTNFIYISYHVIHHSQSFIHTRLRVSICIPTLSPFTYLLCYSYYLLTIGSYCDNTVVYTHPTEIITYSQ